MPTPGTEGGGWVGKRTLKRKAKRRRRARVALSGHTFLQAGVGCPASGLLLRFKLGLVVTEKRALAKGWILQCITARAVQRGNIVGRATGQRVVLDHLI